VDREKLLDRIRRLLRLAESSNPHEAATAAATAQALMDRHRVEAAALDDSVDPGIVDHRDAPLESSKRLRPWKIELAAVLARSNDCRIYVLEGRATDDLVLVGRPEDAEFVRLLYVDMVKRVEALTRRHGAGRDRAFCNGFRLGVVTTLEERLRTLEVALGRGDLPDLDADDGPPLGAEATALARVRLDERRDAVDRFLEQKLNLRAGKSKSLRADAEGYASGRLVGTGLALDRARRPTDS